MLCLRKPTGPVRGGTYRRRPAAQSTASTARQKLDLVVAQAGNVDAAVLDHVDGVRLAQPHRLIRRDAEQREHALAVAQEREVVAAGQAGEPVASAVRRATMPARMVSSSARQSAARSGSDRMRVRTMALPCPAARSSRCAPAPPSATGGRGDGRGGAEDEGGAGAVAVDAEILRAGRGHQHVRHLAPPGCGRRR